MRLRVPPAIHRQLLAAMVAVVAAAMMAPATAAAQHRWASVGMIGGTEMFMDTAAIVRTGSLRKVWIKSVDVTSRRFVAANDTMEFDTVIGLNILDCARRTRTVATVQYLLGSTLVFNVPAAPASPEAIEPRSFFAAVYDDLCNDRHD